MSSTAVIDRAVRDTLGRADRVVLAVSGGQDSVVLMHAAARVAPNRVAAVVTVDHGTGSAATRAARLVERTARSLGFECVRRRVQPQDATEEAWRAERWRVLREVAGKRNARVATAHTRDDQIETVLMRVMRNAGARGLAGLAASGPILRPLLGIDRQQVAAYAAARGIRWVEDPSNQSRAYARNRVRLDLYPALQRARPMLGDELIAIAQAAAEWRDAVDVAIDTLVVPRREADGLHVTRATLASLAPDQLRILWPALAARAGVVLDRRGTERLTSFSISGRLGSRVQLSGGIEAVRHRDEIVLRRSGLFATTESRALDGSAQIGSWRIVRAPSGPSSDWEAALPTDQPLRVRTWRPGDRMVPSGEASERRVKRLLREAGIDAGIRPGWPVVLSGDEIVWVPGVRRGRAATVRSGRPVAVYRCERIDS